MNHLPKRHETTGKVFTQPSQTIPDQTMSIATILRKYARGEQFSQRTPIYTEEETNGIDPRTLDLSEIHEMRINNQKFIDETREKLQKQSAEKESQKRAAEVEREVQLRTKQALEQHGKGSQETSSTT